MLNHDVFDILFGVGEGENAKITIFYAIKSHLLLHFVGHDQRLEVCSFNINGRCVISSLFKPGSICHCLECSVHL